jgi:thiol-disulfide isomerase/thioredoxin
VPVSLGHGEYTDMTGYALLAALLASNATYSTQSYGEAYKSFEDEGRPMVVLIGADWCPGCRTMKMSNLPEAGRRGLLKDVSVAIVDVDQSRQLASKLMQGNSIPQLVMFYKNESGKTKRVQLTGAHGPQAIENFVNQAFPKPSEVASPELSSKGLGELSASRR